MSAEAIMRLPLRKGARGDEVKLLQEWLTLRGFPVVQDGQFGSATEAALGASQKALSEVIREKGVLDASTWSALTCPMTLACEPLPDIGDLSFGESVCAYAERHLAQSPRELPTNRGPWVRLYCRGRDGDEWYWCSGFVHFVVMQAFEHFRRLGSEPPIEDAFPDFARCDSQALYARARSRLVYCEALTKAPLTQFVAKGDLFVARYYVRPDLYHWRHIGIIVRVERDHIVTIEGNTTAAGGRNGDRVAKHYKSIDNLDIIRLPKLVPITSTQNGAV